jgi:hypothetical protein
LGAQESVLKCLQAEMSGQPGSRGVGVFYSPPREPSRWGVKELDMSGSEAGHVRPTSLELGRGTRQVRLRVLTRDKAKSANISGRGSDMSGQPL